ncbi:MAG: hypothetical protein ACRD1K_13015 [Acidimicrobiales bacterium]
MDRYGSWDLGAERERCAGRGGVHPVQYLSGALYSEVSLVRRGGSGRRSASLVPRDLGDYLPARLVRLQRGLAGAALTGIASMGLIEALGWGRAEKLTFPGPAGALSTPDRRRLHGQARGCRLGLPGGNDAGVILQIDARSAVPPSPPINAPTEMLTQPGGNHPARAQPSRSLNTLNPLVLQVFQGEGAPVRPAHENVLRTTCSC